jgi:Flp pilus assembly protein TadG
MMPSKPGEEGGAGVEFALVGGLFLMVVFGILEFGLIWYSKGIIAHASREGARYGVTYSTPPKTAADIQTQVENYLRNMGFNNPVTVTITGAGGSTESPLSVKVDYAYTFLVLPAFVSNLGLTLNLSAETVMRLE